MTSNIIYLWNSKVDESLLLEGRKEGRKKEKNAREWNMTDKTLLVLAESIISYNEWLID